MEFYYPLRLGPRKLKPLKNGRLDEQSTQHGSEVWRNGVECDEYEDKRIPEAQVLAEIQEKASTAENLFWLILAEPGAGKTKLMNAWFRQWVCDSQTTGYGSTVPLLVNLRDLKPDFIDLDLEALGDKLWSLGVENADYLLESAIRMDLVYRTSRARLHRITWLLDGLDELPPELLQERFFRKLAQLPGFKVITCRTAVYQAIGWELRQYQLQEYDLLGLESDEQLEFLAQAIGDDEEARALYNQLECNSSMRRLASNPCNSSMRRLASNPMMLTFIAIIGRHMELPYNRAGFYQKSIVEIWRSKLGGEPGAMDIIDLRDDLLTGIAKVMGLDIIKAPSSLLLKTAREIAPQDWSKLVDWVKKSGILRLDTHEQFEFVHLTFQEFYLARSLSGENFEVTLMKHWHQPQYEETLALNIALLAQKNLYVEIDNAIRSLVNWGEKIHCKNPKFLWQLRCSPLRTVLHLLNRAGIALNMLPNINFILKKICRPRNFHSRRRPLRFLRRLAVARDSQTPGDILVFLASDSNTDIQRAALANFNISKELTDHPLYDMTYEEDGFIQGILFPSIFTDITQYRHWGMPTEFHTFKEDIDEARGTSTANLNRFATHHHEDVRIEVAGNPSTPENALTILSKDDSIDVRYRVAGNINTPLEVLATLAKDKNLNVCSQVAFNKKTLLEDL